MHVDIVTFYGDRPNPGMATDPMTNVYIHVNNDVSDRIMVDPAYKMERMKEAHEKVYAME